MGNRQKKLKFIDILEQEREIPGNIRPPQRMGRISRSLFEINREDVEFVTLEEEMTRFIGIKGVKYYRSRWKNREVATVTYPIDMFKEKTGVFDYEKDFERYSAIASSMCHPNILQFYGCFFDSSREIGFIGEFTNMNLRMLFDETRKNENGLKIPITDKLWMLLSICCVFDYIDSRAMILPHFGLQNIVVDLERITRPMIDSLNITLLGTSLRDNATKPTQSEKQKELLENLNRRYEKYQAPELKMELRKGKLRGEGWRRYIVYLFGILLLEIMTEKFEDKTRTKFTPSERKYLESIGLGWICDMQQSCSSEDPQGRYENIEMIVFEFKEMKKKTNFLTDEENRYNYSVIYFTGGYGEDFDEKERVKDLFISSEYDVSLQRFQILIKNDFVEEKSEYEKYLIPTCFLML